MKQRDARRAAAAMALALLMLIPACRRATAPDLRTRAQRIAVYNGVLAEAVRAAAETAISLQQSGTLTKEQTLMALDYAGRAATVSKAIADIQQTSGEWEVLVLQIQTVLNTISPPDDFARWLGATPQEAKDLYACLDALNAAIDVMKQEASR
jgi:hypothetical protein